MGFASTPTWFLLSYHWILDSSKDIGVDKAMGNINVLIRGS